jgi:hypothetical protein
MSWKRARSREAVMSFKRAEEIHKRFVATKQHLGPEGLGPHGGSAITETCRELAIDRATLSAAVRKVLEH